MKSDTIKQNTLLLDTIAGKKRERPPVWFMRQAGRVLPSYLKLRETHSFRDILGNPELAAQVTLAPIDELGVDAAILFSDILVVPEAMGMNLTFTSTGPAFDPPLKKYSKPSEHLDPQPEKLNYIYKTIENVTRQKPSHIPLIGFCGAPLTNLCYMVQGLGQGRNFPDTIKFIYNNKAETKKCIELLTDLSVEYAEQQIARGIDVFQLFDTHAGIIPFELYRELFLPSVRTILTKVREKGIPTIFFPKGIGTGITEITSDMTDCVSIDWQTSLFDIRKFVDRDISIQGNLDPRLLQMDTETVKPYIDAYIAFGKREDNWIFNLGHGVLPSSSIETTRFVVNRIKNTEWNR